MISKYPWTGPRTTNFCFSVCFKPWTKWTGFIHLCPDSFLLELCLVLRWSLTLLSRLGWFWISGLKWSVCFHVLNYGDYRHAPLCPEFFWVIHVFVYIYMCIWMYGLLILVIEPIFTHAIQAPSLWPLFPTHFSVFILPQSLSTLPKLALNSPCSPDRPWWRQIFCLHLLSSWDYRTI